MKLKETVAIGILAIMTVGAVIALMGQAQDSIVIHTETEKLPASDVKDSNGSETTWAIGPGRIMKTIQTGEDYYALVAVDTTEYRELLPVNSLEYRILEEGDRVDVLYIEEDSKGIDYIDWVRDVDGRLTIHETRPIVVVDAGHGGEDPGRGSNDLWVEKDMALMMAKALEEALEAQDIRVIMTRVNDRYIDLYDRATIADYVGADMFVSCHLNQVSWEASGVEVLYSLKSDADYAVALAQAVAGDDFSVYRVYNRKSDDLPGTDYYFVHKYTDCPSYIIEFGFADNEVDTDYIYDNWLKMVERAAVSISNHIFDTNGK